MAILRNGNNGYSGKSGGHVFYQLNGQEIMRALPKKRTKKISSLEKANREKFKQMQAWLTPLLGYLRIGFRNYAPTFQGFAAAKSYNSKHAFCKKEDGTYFIDPALALVSYGSMPLPRTMTMEVDGDELIATWSTEGHYEYQDTAAIIVYAPDTADVSANITLAKRNKGKGVFSIKYIDLTCEVHVYLAFNAYDQSDRTNSHYLGTLNSIHP